jgi:hypothetical protein
MHRRAKGEGGRIETVESTRTSGDSSRIVRRGLWDPDSFLARLDRGLDWLGPRPEQRQRGMDGGYRSTSDRRGDGPGSATPLEAVDYCPGEMKYLAI